MSKKTFCQFCGGIAHKHGKTSKGTQRYKCKYCCKTFLSNYTPLTYLKHGKTLFKKFIGYMIDDVTLEVAARNLKIDVKTAHYYRYLVFHAIEHYQEKVKLSGTILIDETFISIKEKPYKIVRPDGKNIRGLSFNQLCIITMISLKGECVAKVSSRATAQPDDYKRLFNMNIGQVKAFIHDGNPKQVQFMSQYSVTKVNPRKVGIDNFSTELVDSLHSSLKRYLFKHAGYKLKYLQHYLNFFVYRYNHLVRGSNKTGIIKNKNDILNELYSQVKKSCKNIKYRNYLSDKGITDILENIR